jgi:2-keto-3-deoxy-L-rhamnonate aldolase RhmA
MKIENPVLQRLAKGEPVIGAAMRQARTVDAARIMKTCGYDFLFIDTEHTPVSADTVAQICQAALACGIAPFVRVPNLERIHAVHALDSGAQGIVFPHVENADEARQVVDLCRYAPLGHRSMAYGLPHVGFEALPPQELMDFINRQTLVAVMLETPAAIERCDEIAAVPGIDVLHVGTQDLSAELGCPGEVGAAAVTSAIERVAAACRRHGKIAGVGGCYSRELIERHARQSGAQLFVIGSDLGFLMSAARTQASSVREALTAVNIR